MSHFNLMVEKIDKIIANWNKPLLSLSRKMKLVNFSLLSIPLYYLSVNPILDVIFNRISNKASKFLWSNAGNRSGIHSVNKIDISLDRSKGDLSFKYLRISIIALMAKLVFSFLNQHELIWVYILTRKYGRLNIWSDNIPPNCSWFFWSLCHTSNALKLFLWIKDINPNHVFF